MTIRTESAAANPESSHVTCIAPMGTTERTRNGLLQNSAACSIRRSPCFIATLTPIDGIRMPAKSPHSAMWLTNLAKLV